MNLPIDFGVITEILDHAQREDRTFLFEHEVYSLLSNSGAETVPNHFLLATGNRLTDEILAPFTGDKIVLKIVSPTIIHKTEVQGVRVVENHPDKVRSAVRRMMYEVPERYAESLARQDAVRPERYSGFSGDALINAISRDIEGVLLVQYMPPDSEAFGNELIVSLRATREFGMVITAGLGGTDTELYAERFRKGQAVVTGSTEMHDGQSFFELFRKTIAYKKLAGLTRGQRRIVTNEQLIECFESFIRLGNFFSASKKGAPYVIDELEINPFAFTDFLMVPLDGLCKFSKQTVSQNDRPVEKIDKLLHPKSIGIIGVSATRKNFGRIILDNVIAEGFEKDAITVISDKTDEICDVKCLPSIATLTKPLDLLIVAVGSKQLPSLIEDILDGEKANTVMLVTSGLGETEESKERAEQVVAMINKAHGSPRGGPIFLGANCMGVISKPGGYDTWFIPEEKLPKASNKQFRRSALLSQSGAFMLHRSHQCPELLPAYMISMGNQTDLSLADMIHYFKGSDEVDVIAIYAEGFNDLDGLSFCKGVREAVLAGKEVLFYKAGRTAEGKAATSGHTASLAGDYVVCESCVKQAGAIVARTFSEFQELYYLLSTQSEKVVHGNRLAAISGAGFEAVGMADSIESDDFQSQLAKFTHSTQEKLRIILQRKKLDSLVSIVNPLDINPAADDETHGLIAQAVLDDSEVDALIISLDPLSPVTQTMHASDSKIYDMEKEGGIKERVLEIAKNSSKPMVVVVDGGRVFDPLRDALTKHGVPVFSVCDHAVATLSLYLQGRLHSDSIRSLG